MTNPSAFLSLWQGARVRLDAVFAETFQITPMTAVGNNRPSQDLARSAMAFQAGYLSPSVDQFGESPGHASNSGQRAVTSKPSLIMSVEALPYRPAPSDIVARLSNGETFSIATVEPDGYGRLSIGLTTRRAAA